MTDADPRWVAFVTGADRAGTLTALTNVFSTRGVNFESLSAGSVAAHVPAPLIGLSLGFVPVHLMADKVGVWWSFAAGVLVCLAWNGVLWILRQRQRAQAAA